MKLQGKVALITGASGGMGSLTALEFAREGARAIGIQYSKCRERANSVAKAVRKLGPQASVLRADVSRKSEVESMVNRMVESFGTVDILVCYAGHPFSRKEWFMPFEELTEDIIRKPLDVDLLGSLYCAQAVVPIMKKSRSGKIIFVGSTSAITGDAVGLQYLIAKAGVIALTKALAWYLGPYNIHVNAIAPGSIETEPMKAYTAEEARALVHESALKRMGKPLEIARKAVYLASEDSDFQTGTTVVVDGGYAMW